MFKRFVMLALIFTPIVILSTISIKQFKENQMYESYIFNNVSNNTQETVNSIVQIDQIFKEILENDRITKDQVHLLETYYSSILFSYQRNSNLANQFNRRVESDSESVKNSLRSISNFFEKIEKESFKSEDESIAITSALRGKMFKFKELNGLWIKDAMKIKGVKQEGSKVVFNSKQYRNYYENRSINNEFWVDLLKDINKSYKVYIDKHNLIDIKSLL